MGGRKISGVAVMALSVSLLAGAAPVFAESNQSSSEPRSVSVLGPRDARLVRAISLAVAEASRRLENSGCRQLFSDFADGAGAPLAAKLDEAGQDGRGYLGWLIFRNGSHEVYCDSGDVALAAQPASRFVAVCGMRFVELQASDPGYAAALVLHEELHVLGLGENPPSSAEITARVFARCGR